MGSKIQKLNRAKYHSQGGRCHYCGQPMWIEQPDEFCREFRLTVRRAAHFQSTAEHLVAQCDGGRDEASNIVAACRFCNGRRHRSKKPLSPLDYQKKVRRRLLDGKWHGFLAGRTI